MRKFFIHMAYVTPGGFKWDTVHEKIELLKCKKYEKT